MRVWLFLVLSASAEPATPSSRVLSQTTPVAKLDLRAGLVRWVNRRELPNTAYSVRGSMIVDLYPDLVMVRQSDGGLHVFPREYLVYAGTWDAESEESPSEEPPSE